jgi:hypothetical protein
MWYKEALAMRRALVVFAIVVAVLGALNAWGAGDSGGIYLSQALDVACFAAIVLALVVGTHLGSERGAQARLALLRPVPRERYAWTIFVVDMVALVVAYGLGVLFIAGTYEAAHGFAPMDFHGVTATTAVLLPLAAIFAFYGLTALCAVAARGALAVSLLVGPVCLVVWVGGAIYRWPAAQAFRLVCIVNPLMYLASAIARIEDAAHPTPGSTASGGGFYAALPVGVDCAMLLAIAAIALLIATFLWKRAEV